MSVKYTKIFKYRNQKEILPFSNDFIEQINFNNRIEYISNGRTFDYPTTVKKMKNAESCYKIKTKHMDIICLTNITSTVFYSFSFILLKR
jgi:UDP-galactopyranose mutase